ncbi:MAG TPA: type IV toxin-antitoxin system AbiEi family antitoxin domain-containing protein [Solirubrobacterales bacterium]|nr:type IV toxin-antitoxin system AbiEi family antitoxin domain-containing protein [Solirubrobacterales bacterium]
MAKPVRRNSLTKGGSADTCACPASSGPVHARRIAASARYGRIAALADRQDGVVTASQLEALGVGDSTVFRLTRAGYLFRVHRGVYTVGRARATERGRIRAGVFACGSDAVASHHTAAYLHQLTSRLPRPIQVTRPAGGRASHRGVEVTQVRRPGRVARVSLYGIPTTTVAQTLFDLAARTPRGEVEDLIDLAATAQRRRLLDLAALRQAATRNAGRPGARAFGRLLARLDPDVLATRSRMERHVLRLCREAGLPAPRAGATIIGYEVDLVWAEQRLIVEFDSRAFHTDVRAFERDRERDARHLQAGYRTLRITYRMLMEDRREVVRRIALLVGAARGLP